MLYFSFENEGKTERVGLALAECSGKMDTSGLSNVTSFICKQDMFDLSPSWRES